LCAPKGPAAQKSVEISAGPSEGVLSLASTQRRIQPPTGLVRTAAATLPHQALQHNSPTPSPIHREPIKTQALHSGAFRRTSSGTEENKATRPRCRSESRLISSQGSSLWPQHIGRWLPPPAHQTHLKHSCLVASPPNAEQLLDSQPLHQEPVDTTAPQSHLGRACQSSTEKRRPADLSFDPAEANGAFFRLDEWKQHPTTTWEQIQGSPPHWVHHQIEKMHCDKRCPLCRNHTRLPEVPIHQNTAARGLQIRPNNQWGDQAIEHLPNPTSDEHHNQLARSATDLCVKSGVQGRAATALQQQAYRVWPNTRVCPGSHSSTCVLDALVKRPLEYDTIRLRRQFLNGSS